MTAAERLRTAAARMRALAEAAESAWDTPWEFRDLGYNPFVGMTYRVTAPGTSPLAEASTEELAEHIAAMHPAVALAVADWLDFTADDLDRAIESDQRLQQILGHPLGDGPPFPHHLAALKVADAFLGATP